VEETLEYVQREMMDPSGGVLFISGR